MTNVTTGQEAPRTPQAFLTQMIWAKLEVPVAEIIVHTVVTVLSLLSIAGVEFLLHWLGLDGKPFPRTNITLSEWMFYLEVLAATLIISIGIIKAVIGLVRS